ncbi:MAG TPA: hypothetical protein VE085_01140 [Burkholderiales bacterium]|nr:hypothetical protein [Burkholderiales bacterium]
MESEETLRWPTNLDRHAIEQRLAQARTTAEKNGWTALLPFLSDIEGKPAAEIAKKVMAALDWLQAQPEQRAFTLQLQMVALNLKNLK